MLISLALIILFGLILARFMEKIGLARIIGMLLAGIVLGPHLLNLLDEKILLVSADLRQIALIIILIKAGLSLNINDLKRSGRQAFLLSFLPALFEILAYGLLAGYFLKLDLINSLLLGSVIAAVSPAVVVPRMVNLIEKGFGKKKPVPQMVLVGASCDDIFVLVIFSSLLSIAKGEGVGLIRLVDVPISIASGVLVGIFLGLALHWFFESFYNKDSYTLDTDSLKVIIILAISFALSGIEGLVKGKFAFSSLLAIISMSLVLGERSNNEDTERLGSKFNKLWIFAEILLFVLVGAEVDIFYTRSIGIIGIILIFLGLVFRSIGVQLSLIGSDLNKKERLFTSFAYLPKATVQAAIGSVALEEGLASGQAILSMAVLAILITAPLGAILIDKTHKKLLER